MGYYNIQNNASPIWDSDICQYNAIIAIFAGTMDFVYNCFFCIYVLFLIKNSLQRRDISPYILHSAGLAFPFSLTLFAYLNDSTGLTLFGTCSYGVNPGFPIMGVIISLLYLGISFLTIFYYRQKFKHLNLLGQFTTFETIIETENNMMKQMKISKIQLQLGRFLILIVVFTNIIYLVLSTSNFLVGLNCTKMHQQIIYTIFGTTGNIFKLFVPLFLSLVRLTDPFIRTKVRGIFTTHDETHDFSSSAANLDSSAFVAHHNPYAQSQSMSQGNIIYSIIIRVQYSLKSINIHKQRQTQQFEENGNFQQVKSSNINNAEQEFELNKPIQVIDQTNIKENVAAHIRSKSKGPELDDDVSESERIHPEKEEERFFSETILFESDKFDLENIEQSLFVNAEGDFEIYAPKIFSYFRYIDRGVLNPIKSFDLQQNAQKIQRQFGGNQEGKGGASGEFFYFTEDRSMILKTINQEELDFYIKNIKNFYLHYRDNKDSLLNKFYGIFTYRHPDFQIHLCLMRNISMVRSNFIMASFDMKGSSLNRESLKKIWNPKQKNNKSNQVSENQEETLPSDAQPDIIITSKMIKKETLKDVDFLKLIEQDILNFQSTELNMFQRASEILKADAEFLVSQGRMDYSLLLMISEYADVNQEKYEKIKLTSLQFSTIPVQMGQYAQQSKQELDGKQYFVHLAIIDYLQEWNCSQILQRGCKIICKQCNRKADVSALQPQPYRDRFINKVINKIFRHACDQN